MRIGIAAGVALCAMAAAATAAAEVAALTVVVAPASVVLGSGVAVAVQLQGAAAARWSASVGEVRAGVLELGDRRAPGFAIVAADADGARAAAVVELVGAGELPTETTPGAQVTVEIDGRSFGPVTADKAGQAAVPVEVPPRARVVKVIAIDKRGLSTTREIQLPAAPWPRALVIAPRALRAGDDAVVTVFALDEDGGWRDAGAAPPQLALPDTLAEAGPARPVAPGRWDLPVRGVAAAEDVEIGAFVDGAAAVPARLAITPRPAVVVPPPPGVTRKSRADVSLRAGASFGPVTAFVLGAEAAVPVRRGQPTLLLIASLLRQSGHIDQFAGDSADADLTQLCAGVGAGVRFALAPAWQLDAQLGLGWDFASTHVAAEPMGDASRTEKDGALLLWGGASLARSLGPGALLLDLRWLYARLAPPMLIDGNALGFSVAIGYRLDF